MAEAWRVFMICSIRPIAEALAGELRALGHEPVALLTPRRPAGDTPPEFLELTGSKAPPGIDLLFAKDKWSIERLVRAYEPDLTICWGFPWKIPQAALDVARLGSINHHPGLLPRHRGPIPFAWTLRSGDTEWGFTWHRMDAELDTGNILGQVRVPLDDEHSWEELTPKLAETVGAMLPAVLARVESGDPGDPQDETQASYLGKFEPEYVRIDWARPAAEIERQVRAWRFHAAIPRGGALAEVDGELVRVLRVSREAGKGTAMACGDGTLWIVETEEP